MTAFSDGSYPRVITLRDGTELVLRAPEAGDSEALLRFFQGLPATDTHFMKDDVLNPETIARWLERPDGERSLVLLGFAGERVVADAALIRQRGAARHHLAELRVNISPDFQGRGLGTLLIRELADRAWDAEIEVLEFQLVQGFQDAAIEAVRGVGAFHAGTLKDYLRDPRSEPCSLAFYQLPLGAWFKF
ncbi:MAG: N-acetyltransferase family protein [Dehalococcoidia bacterium]